MPYYEVDPEFAEEMAEYGQEIPSGSFYESAESQFDFGKLRESTRALYEALVEKGFESVVCRYDGGYDEGFAYFENASVKGTLFGPGEVGELFKDSVLGDANAVDLEHYPEPARAQILQRIEATPREQRVTGLLEEFADELAVSLLGQGYGTGEMTLRGRFRARLADGRVEDLEEDPGPSEDF